MRNMDVRSLLRTFTLALAFVGAACSCVAAKPYELSGKCIGIVDGDTIDIRTADKKTHRIRLAEIDAPERYQPFGSEATAALAKMVLAKNVTVKVTKRERWDRELGNVYLGDVDVNGSLVRYGWAHVYVQYKHRPILLDYELEARELRRGLWADEKAIILPWLWRKGSRP